MNEPAAFARYVRKLLAAWAALIVLMLLSLGSAYLPLGPWNAVAGLVIAAVKSAIVLVLFMGLGRAVALLRLAAAAGVFTLCLLFALTEVDYRTRTVEPAAMQQPQQLRPLREGGSMR